MTNGAIDFTKPLPNGAANGQAMHAPPITILDGPAIGAPLPPVPYLVRELALVAGGGPPHLVAGYGYSGKTLAMQSLALSLATGRAVWGVYSTGEVRRVLHVDFEQGDFLTRQRFQRLARAMGVDVTSLEDRIAAVVLPRFALTREYEACWLEVMTGRDLVIIDSLRAATRGMDENASTIRGPLDMLTELSERTRCRALVIHHARKPSEHSNASDRYSIRGSGAIFDATDCAFVLSASEKGAPIKVAHERAKSDGRTVDDFALVIADIANGDDLRAGLALRVHGSELLAEHASSAADARAQRYVERDAEAVRRVLAKRTAGVPAMDLRAAAHIDGPRFARAILHLGSTIVSRSEKRGETRSSKCFYLRQHMPDMPDDGGRSAENPPSSASGVDDGQPIGESANISDERSHE